MNNKEQSLAMKRFNVDDGDNPFFTLFRYSPVKGLGYEPGIGRRDPSNIIKVEDTYYIWYTRISGGTPVGVPKSSETRRAYKWDLAEIWFATSKNGVDWKEQGIAIKRGKKGRFDDRSVFTPNVLVAEGKYYLVYQAVKAPYVHRTKNVAAMAVSESPDGPWKKFDEPVLKPDDSGVWAGNELDEEVEWTKTETPGAWDSMKIHDPGFLVRDGKYWLYYKGQQIGKHPWESKWGVAIADKPEGPYIKSLLNPITSSGHEIWMWPYKSGVAAMVDWAGPEKNTIQYSEDGLNFEVVSAVENIPPAGGAYIPDLFTNTNDGKGFTWGLCHHSDDNWDFLVHFDCDLERGKEKDFITVYDDYAKIKAVYANRVLFYAKDH